MDLDEIYARVGSNDRGVGRGGTGDRVDTGRAWRNSKPADAADAHPSVSARPQRDHNRAHHESSDSARNPEANPKSIRASGERSRFQHSELEEAGISTPVQDG